MDKLGYIQRDGMLLEPVSCQVCQFCWREKGKARCIHGGPYLGYAEVKDEGEKEQEAP